MTAWVLLLLDSGATHGYGLQHEFTARHLTVEPSVMYRTLRKLEADGLVESRWMKPQAGPRRRIYRVTPKGRRILDEVAVLITDMRDLHEDFIVAHKRSIRQRSS